MLLSIATFVYPVRAINVYVNQHTFVLSNEASGYAISALVNSGYANYSLYDTLLAIRADADPSVSGILSDAFLSTLGNAPVSSKIFTTQLKDVNSQGATIGINTDGTILTNGVIMGIVNFTTLTNGDIFGSTYQGKQGITSLDTVVSSVGSFQLVYNSSGSLTSWTINGPLAGMTTIYNIIGILYEPLSSASPSPISTSTPTASSNPTQTQNPTTNPSSTPSAISTSNPTSASQPTPMPSVPEFSTLTILLTITVVSITLLTLLKGKKN
jgi:hypothetical protein